MNCIVPLCPFLNGLLDFGKRAMPLSLSLQKGFTLPLSTLLSLVSPSYNSWWSINNSGNSVLGRKWKLFLSSLRIPCITRQHINAALPGLMNSTSQ